MWEHSIQKSLNLPRYFAFKKAAADARRQLGCRLLRISGRAVWPSLAHQIVRPHRELSADYNPALVDGAITRGRRMMMMATPAMVQRPPTIINRVNWSSKKITPESTPNSGTSSVNGIT